MCELYRRGLILSEMVALFNGEEQKGVENMVNGYKGRQAILEVKSAEPRIIFWRIKLLYLDLRARWKYYQIGRASCRERV